MGTGRRATIAVLIDLRFYYGRCVFEGICGWARESGWKIIYFPAYDTHPDPAGEVDASQIDGLIIQAVNPAYSRLRRLRRPVINTSGVCQDQFPTVRTDNREIGRLAARHLMEQPLTHFAYFGEPDRVYSLQREAGFVEVLSRAGHDCRSLTTSQPTEVVRWVRSLPRPVGIMASSDLRAAWLLYLCLSEGIEVRERIALIGVDNDHHVCEAAFPRLTSVEQQATRIGYEAGRMLNRVMAGRSVPDCLLLPPQGVVTRESSVLHVVDTQMGEALRIIRQAPGQLSGVSDLAARVAMSRRTLERRFRLVQGCSPAHAIQRSKLALAARLLTETDLSVAAIAQRCGFSSSTRLGIAFHREFGVTPSQHRKRSLPASNPGI